MTGKKKKKKGSAGYLMLINVGQHSCNNLYITPSLYKSSALVAKEYIRKRKGTKKDKGRERKKAPSSNRTYLRLAKSNRAKLTRCISPNDNIADQSTIKKY
jgi:hypothetical protein